MNRIIQGTMAAVAAVSFIGAALAQLSAEDRKFLEEAAAGGMAEVELGKMAQQKGSTAEVRQFGKRMETDHGKANEELKRIAKAKGIELAAGAKAHQKQMDQVARRSGRDFDASYMNHMVRDHKKDVAAFRKQAKDGKDPELKAFAAKALPTLEEHLKLAQDTQSGLVGGRAAAAGGKATPNPPAKGTTK